jgi:G:T/U-mismatch repair DNA glycosylase
MPDDTSSNHKDRHGMLPEIWEPNLTVVFAGTVITETCDKLGFYHLHPRDRFWELLEIQGITPNRIMTPQERKALTDGHAQGSISDPIRTFFLQKRTSQVLRLGIGLTDLNRRLVVENEKDKSGKPNEADIQEFIARVEMLTPRAVAFVTAVDVFVAAFRPLYPGATAVLGLQPFTIGKSEVWLLGSTTLQLRGEALRMQEDAFFALGERLEALKAEGREL